jgi:hypothetical protein
MRPSIFSADPKDFARALIIATLGAISVAASAWADDSSSGEARKDVVEFTQAIRAPEFVARIEGLLNSDLSKSLGLSEYRVNLTPEEVLPGKSLAAR